MWYNYIGIINVVKCLIFLPQRHYLRPFKTLFCHLNIDFTAQAAKGEFNVLSRRDLGYMGAGQGRALTKIFPIYDGSLVQSPHGPFV